MIADRDSRAAAEQILDALDAHHDGDGHHDREGVGVVDMPTDELAAALLAAGWSPPNTVTPAGSPAAALARLNGPEIALFDGVNQVTPWEPYDITMNTPVRAPRRLTGAELLLRTRTGSQMKLSVQSIVEEGDRLSLPPPSEWRTGRW